MFRTSFYYICVIACFANYGNYYVIGITKYFKHNTSIWEPSNWINNADNCNGVVFGDEIYGPIVINKLVTKELVLPLNLDNLIILDGGYIEFSTDSKISNEYGVVKNKDGNDITCIAIKSLGYSDWHDGKNWEFEGSDNLAIPDLDRTPCIGDDVVVPFPSSIVYYRYLFYETGHLPEYTAINSLKYGDKQFTNTDLQKYLQSDLGSVLFNTLNQEQSNLVINETSQKCATPKQGCLCSYLTYSCDSFIFSTDCDEPLYEGFCNSICGAVIEFAYNEHIGINRLNKIVEDYTDVYTYVSQQKCTKGEGICFQIIIREKDFSGMSGYYGKTIFEKLYNDAKTFGINTATMSIRESGAVKLRHSIFGSAIALILGTLVGVIMLFSILFYLYGAEERLYAIRNGFGFLSARPLSTLRPSFMARYVNTEDESGLIFESHSLAGSVISLQKSFENPMFGTNPEPSTSTSSADAEVKIITDKERKSISLENPLYDIKIKEESGDSEDIMDIEE